MLDRNELARNLQVNHSPCKFLQVNHSTYKFLQVNHSTCKFLQVNPLLQETCKILQVNHLLQETCKFLQVNHSVSTWVVYGWKEPKLILLTISVKLREKCHLSHTDKFSSFFRVSWRLRESPRLVTLLFGSKNIWQTQFWIHLCYIRNVQYKQIEKFVWLVIWKERRSVV